MKHILGSVPLHRVQRALSDIPLWKAGARRIHRCIGGFIVLYVNARDLIGGQRLCGIHLLSIRLEHDMLSGIWRRRDLGGGLHGL